MYVLDPLHDYAIVHALPEVMQRISASDPDAPRPAWVPRDGKGLIALPDSMASGGMPADSGTNARSNKGAVTTLLVGRVVTVGPGKHRDGAFITPSIKRGDLVLFMPRTVSYEFSVHGKSIKIVPYAELVSTVREVDAASREWLDFLALVEKAANEVERDTQEARSEAV